MKIHTVKEGDTLSSIAESYGTDIGIIKRDNELEGDTIIAGEELLILTPTRTYLPNRSDSIQGISHRFGVKVEDILAFNPNISESGMTGALMALKYEPRKFGSAAANGCFYRGCSTEKLKKVLPYLTYLTFAAASCEDSGIRMLFNPAEALKIISDTGIIPLLKVFDNRKGYDLLSSEKNEKFGDKLIEAAKSGGFSGIVLDFSECELTDEAASGFLMELRRKMIGSDLILLVETDENTPLCISDLSDGCTLSYPLCKSSFDSELLERMEKYSSESESARTFLDIMCFALQKEDYFPVCDAMGEARRCSSKLKYDEKTRTLSFTHKKRGEIRMPSLEYIKGILEAVNKYDFMGICFDIENTPLPYLLMYNSIFKTVKGTRQRAKEGCSKE